MIKRIFFNISWLSVEKILSIIIILSVEGILARSLDSVNYGIYQYSLNLSLLITMVVGVIPGEVVVPIITKYKHQKIKIIKSIILSRLIISTILLIPIFFSLSLFNIDDKAKILIIYFTCSLIFIEIFGVIINYYQSIVESKLVVLLRLLSITVRLILVLLVYKISSNIYSIGYIRLFDSLLLICLLVYTSRKLIFNDVRVDFKTVKIIIFKGIKIWPSILIYYLLLRLDRIAVEHFFDYTMVGLYSVSQQLIDQIMVFLIIIISSLFPIYVYKERNISAVRSKVIKIMVLMVSISIVAMISVYFLGGKFIYLVYGQAFEQSYSILMVMMFLLPLSVIDYMSNQIFIFIGRYRLVFIKNITGLFLLVLLYGLFAKGASINNFPIYIIITNIYMVLFSGIVILKERD